MGINTTTSDHSSGTCKLPWSCNYLSLFRCGASQQAGFRVEESNFSQAYTKISLKDQKRKNTEQINFTDGCRQVSDNEMREWSEYVGRKIEKEMHS